MRQIGVRIKMADDPQVDPKKLDNLAKRDRLAALRHPQATKEQLVRWLNIKVKKGLEDRLAALEQNPALELFWLDAPPGPYDPLAVSLWTVRYEKMLNALDAALKPLSEQQMMAWCEHEIHWLLEELKRREPDIERKFHSILNHVFQHRPPGYTEIEFGLQEMEVYKQLPRPLDYAAWAIIYWLDSWRLGSVNSERAKNYIGSSIRYTYVFRCYEPEFPTGSWQRKRHVTLQFQAEVDGLQAFLAGKTSVGARTKVSDDMMVDPKKLEGLAKRDRLAALRHPQASKDQLVKWLAVHPKTGGVPPNYKERLAALEQNPSLPLFWLEAPPAPNDDLMWAIWAMRFAIATEEINNALAKLTPKQMVAWAEKEIWANLHRLRKKDAAASDELTEIMDKILSSEEFRKSLESKEDDLLAIYSQDIYPSETRDLIMAILIFEDAYTHLLASEHAQYPMAKLRVAKDQAEASLSYSYYCHFENFDRYKIKGWQDRRYYTQHQQALLTGLRSFLAGETTQVGARKKMADNMELPAAKLENLAKRDKLAALRHPMASKEQLTRWLGVRPTTSFVPKDYVARLEALEQNQALPLLWLEGPPGSFDPLMIAIWFLRYTKASQAKKDTYRDLTDKKVMAWCEYAILQVLPDMEQVYPEQGGQIRALIRNVLEKKPPRHSDIAYAKAHTERQKEGLERPYNFIAWAMTWLISAWTAFIQGEHILAKERAELGASYTYMYRFGAEYESGSWQMYRQFTQQVEAETEGLRQYLSTSVGGISRRRQKG